MIERKESLFGTIDGIAETLASELTQARTQERSWYERRVQLEGKLQMLSTITGIIKAETEDKEVEPSDEIPQQKTTCNSTNRSTGNSKQPVKKSN